MTKTSQNEKWCKLQRLVRGQRKSDPIPGSPWHFPLSCAVTTLQSLLFHGCMTKFRVEGFRLLLTVLEGLAPDVSPEIDALYSNSVVLSSFVQPGSSEPKLEQNLILCTYQGSILETAFARRNPNIFFPPLDTTSVIVIIISPTSPGKLGAGSCSAFSSRRTAWNQHFDREQSRRVSSVRVGRVV
jgi:hypothetical protein